MPKKYPMTQKALAARLQVSVATISNAFNRPDQLSAALRDHILREAGRLGYRHGQSAGRALRTGKTDTIAIVLPDPLANSLSDAIAMQLLQGIGQILESQGYRMLLIAANAGQQQSLSGVSADGYIIYGEPQRADILPTLVSEGRPIVTVDFRRENLPCVCIDNYRAAYDVVSYALATGRHPAAPVIAALGLFPANKHAAACRLAELNVNNFCSLAGERLRGYVDAMVDAGIGTDDMIVWNFNSHAGPEIAAQMGQLIDRCRPDMLICMSDMLALHAQSQAEQQKISVPGQLALIGFDGIEAGQLRMPYLTTVRQDSVLKGRYAAQRVLDENAPSFRLIGTSVIYGQSAG
ncbi:LacI family transcriptional regulator [Affinibrenneria salicis]|uniref:LacI family transcriptional regulator n=1 Tax=Affinibrenneria salicis TaxID=2590031 RepID=A0A5J5FUB5_9GAMM|nr:substrate-binding domain-containing protein [Affinibrenneria salicis]KAA8996866.1 LacI family transcriptional regulator [Affinibrenneria salicis]